MIAFVWRMTHKVFVVFGVLGLIFMVAIAARVSAFTEPGITGNWADFANCPANIMVLLPNSRCEHSYTTGGVVQIGHSSVPISVPGDTFDLGASMPEPEGVAISPLHGILNGPAQPVPGGLLGAVGDTEVTGVTAKLEWAVPSLPGAPFGIAAPCSKTPDITFNLCSILNSTLGTGVTLSVKIHLMSPFLGGACYIGSAANPIVIPLTTGLTSPPPPAHPIHGQSLEFLRALSGEREQAFGLTLVNNSFTVPTAQGCGTSNGNLVNSSINHKLGLPSPAGQNSILINAVGEQASPAEVLVHGWTE